MSEWIDLADLPRPALKRAWRQGLAGAQWLARIAAACLPPRPDDAHLALIWRDEAASSLEPTREFRSAPHIRLSEPVVARFPVVGDRVIAAYAPGVHKIWLGAEARPNNVLQLEGRSPETIAGMLPQILDSLGVDASGFSTVPPFHRADARAGEAETAALCRCYANVNGLFEDLPMRNGPVRLRPRGLEMVCLVSLDAKAPEARVAELAFEPGGGEGDAPVFSIRAVGPSDLRRPPVPPSTSPWRWRADGAEPRLSAPADALLTGPGARDRTAAALGDGLSVMRNAQAGHTG